MNLFRLWEQSYRIRAVERAISENYKDQEMRCPVHLSIGQEVNAVLLCEFLYKTDYILSSHRSHAHFLAKGGKIRALLGELYGKSSGCSRGFGGSMHLVDRSCGFMGSTSIVGGTIPVGVGMAFHSKLRGDGRITAICLGDAAIEEGVFHEAWNFANLHSLPVIFYCENNLYSCYTHINDRKKRGEIKIPGNHIVFKKNDFHYQSNQLKIIINAMRTKRMSPVFIEVPSYRMVEHCGPSNDDHLNYREPKEIENNPDPFKILEDRLLAQASMPKELMDQIKRKHIGIANETIEQVKKDPYPDQEELGRYTYA